MSRLRTALTGALLLPALLALVAPSSQAAEPEAVMRLLDQKRCEGCRLQDADLVQADLRDARLQGAQLQRANLSGARLDGADLRGADLSFTSLAGASLRGANLQGSRLEGTDLRQSDLSGAELNSEQLSRSHWQEATGVNPGSLTYADLHNAGIKASLNGNHPAAEKWLSEAIQRQPNAGITWMARGVSRMHLGNGEMAQKDFLYAADLYELSGDTETAMAIRKTLKDQATQKNQKESGTNTGSMILQAGFKAISTLAPLAIKALAPIP